LSLDDDLSLRPVWSCWALAKLTQKAPPSTATDESVKNRATFVMPSLLILIAGLLVVDLLAPQF